MDLHESHDLQGSTHEFCKRCGICTCTEEVLTRPCPTKASK